MTDRPRVPDSPMGEFLDLLPDATGRALLGHLSAGALNARHAVQCVADAGARRHRTLPQLVGYLSEAIRELEAALEIVTDEQEGRVTA
jgi:hypothetical protein